MKAFFLFLLTFCLTSLPNNVSAQSQHTLDRNFIFTQGTAEITGQNDSARIHISVQTEAREMEKAAADNAAKTDAVIEAIKALDIRDLKKKTANYRVTPKKDFKARPPVIRGYEVVNEIVITTEGFEPKELSAQVSKVVGTALEAGANMIRNIQFYINDRASLEKQGLRLATQEAVEQANVLAEAAGVRLGRIVSISTQPIAVPFRGDMFKAAGRVAGDASMEPPIESGESSISVHVDVVHEME